MNTPILSLVLLLLAPLDVHAFGGKPARNENTRAAMKEIYEVLKQHQIEGRLQLPGGCRMSPSGATLAESNDSRGQTLFINMDEPRHSSSFNMHEQYDCKRVSNGYQVAYSCAYEFEYCEDTINCREKRRARAEFEFRYIPPTQAGGRAEITRLQSCQ